MTNTRSGGFLLFALVSLTLLGAACGGDANDDASVASQDVETLAGDSSTTTADPIAVSAADGENADAMAEGSEAAPADPTDEDAGESSTTSAGDSTTGAAPGSSATSTPGNNTAAPTSTAASSTTAMPSSTAPTTTAANPVRCLVRLHGKGGGGRAPSDYGNGIRMLNPQGNSQAWGGHQWLYFPESGYDETVGIVTAAVNAEGCTDVVINGFSNGAAFAGKLFCRGESFGGRLRGVVIDDPVPDNGTANCSPAGGVQRVLYWTGKLADAAPAGTDCARIDWTCDGGTSVGIDSYAQRLGASITASPYSEHKWYRDAPETTAFFN